MTFNVFLLIFTYIVFTNIQYSVQLNELKCLVCQEIVREINDAVLNEDPKKTLQIGSFRIQPDGSQKQAQVKYAGSELHLSEVLETICNSMDNFAQAKHKETREMALLNLSKDVDKLNIYELVHDPDLNRSLKYYCETFVEDHEDEIIRFFKESETEVSGANRRLCSEVAGYCSAYHIEL